MSRKRICGRAINAGPGSCHYWWENCPNGVGHCFIRFVEQNSHLKTAPEDVQRAALLQWEAARAIARDPQPGLGL